MAYTRELTQDGPLQSAAAGRWARRAGDRYSLSIYPGSQRSAAERLRECVAGRAGLYGLYGTSAWWDHLVETSDASRLRLAVLHDAQGQVAAVAPIEIAPHTLQLSVRRRPLLRMRLSAAHVLGGRPAGVHGGVHLEHFVRHLWRALPEADAIYFKGIPADDLPLGAHARRRRDDPIVWDDDNFKSLYLIHLPSSFDAYLARFARKRAYNLKRQVRLLDEQGGIELARIEHEGQVDAFVEGAREVARHSWQHQLVGAQRIEHPRAPEVMKDLARRGLLRAYLLKSAGRPCAYATGYQGAGVFHYADIAYDERMARCSPGSVLLYLLIRDLIEWNRPEYLNFGLGDSEYKRQFATERRAEGSLLLMRNSAANWLRANGCGLLRSAIRGGKWLRDRVRGAAAR